MVTTTTKKPTQKPTRFPSRKPSLKPSKKPAAPTRKPTRFPSFFPSYTPSSYFPTFVPTIEPSVEPSIEPSVEPSFSPSFEPTTFQQLPVVKTLSTDKPMPGSMVFATIIFVFAMLFFVALGYQVYKKSKKSGKNPYQDRDYGRQFSMDEGIKPDVKYDYSMSTMSPIHDGNDDRM